MAKLFPPGYQFTDDNGDPVASGYVYFYENTTTTNKAIYTNAALSSAATNPAPLNSAGRFNQGDLYGSGTYTVALKTSALSQIWSRDDFLAGTNATVANISIVGSVAGTNTVTGAITPTLTEYVVNDIYVITPANTNTGAATLNLDTVGAGAVKLNGSALVGGEMVQNVPLMVQVTAVTPVFEIIANGAPNAATIKANTISELTSASGVTIDGILIKDSNIKFPGTQSASSDVNTLDDYEEGSWTPVISDGTNNATSSTAVGRYTKIGNRVFISGRIILTSLGSVSGDTRITGLPFAADNISSLNHSIDFGDAGGLAIAQYSSVGGYVVTNSSYISLILWDATTGVSALQGSEISADGDLTFAGSYQTA